MTSPRERSVQDFDLGFGPLEARVMDVLWARGGWLTVGDTLESLNAGRRRKLAYSTVKTILTNLGEKGHLRRRVAGRAYEYEPVRSRAEAERGVVRDFVRPVVARGGPLLAHLVDELGVDDATVAALEELIARKRRERGS